MGRRQARAAWGGGGLGQEGGLASELMASADAEEHQIVAVISQAHQMPPGQVQMTSMVAEKPLQLFCTRVTKKYAKDPACNLPDTRAREWMIAGSNMLARPSCW